MTIQANTSGALYFTNDNADVTPQFQPGSTVIAADTSYTYAKAAAAIAAAGTVALTGSFGATTTTSGSTYTHDVASPGVPINYYFWAKKVTTPF